MVRWFRTSSPRQGGEVPGFRDLEPIGYGGFSTVYRAFQERFDRTVALKVLTVDLVDERARQRFRRECLLAGRLTGHPNIVTVLDAGVTREGRPFIAMEYLDGGSMADQLRRDGPLPLDEVLRTGIKLAGALAAAHDAGVVHRDIKPQNILLSRFGEPALADFGIAILTSGIEGAAVTQGLTPLYAAPEMLEGATATAATDVYSLGSTLYKLLAGRAAYEREDDNGLAPLLLRILQDAPPAIARDDLPDGVLAVLREAMAKDPADRFGSAAAFGERLQQLQSSLGLPATEMLLAADPQRQPAPARDTAMDGGAVARLRSEFLTPPAAPSAMPPATAVPAPPVPAAPPPLESSATAPRLPAPPAPIPSLPAPSDTDPSVTAPRGVARPLAPPVAAPLPEPEPLPDSSGTVLRERRRPLGPVEQQPARRRGRGLLVACLVAVALGVASFVGVQLLVPGLDRPAAQGTQAEASTTTVPRAVINAARPSGLVAVADGTTATLHWHNPTGSRYPLFLEQSSALAKPRLQPIGNGTTTTTVSGLDVDRGYCFRVVAAISFGSRPVLAASAPACIRGGV